MIKSDKSPNIVFIFTDQQRYDTLSVYGNNKIKVPNLNKLAEESAVFKKAYVTQPVCTPSRATIMTGLYPHNHGCDENNKTLKDDIPSIVELIEDSVYKTGYVGKWHLGNEISPQHGFHKWVSMEDYSYRKYFEREEDKELNCSYHHFLIKNGFKPDYEEGDYKAFTRYFCTRLPEQFSKPAFIGQEASEFIKENKDNPFILYVNFLEPHPPYYSAFDDMYNPEDVDFPETFNDEPGEDIPFKHTINIRYHRDVGRHYPMTDEKTWRKLIARYWGAISLVDKYTGMILDTLRESGVEENTIVIFTSDHGDMMGEFKMLAKFVMHEGSVRVPMLVKIPGVTDEQVIIDEPVSQVDLVATLLDIIGEKPCKATDGKSLYPIIKGNEKLQDNNVFIEWNGKDGEARWFKQYMDTKDREIIERVIGAAVRTIVTQDGWKLAISESGENLLYNLNEDPKELRNLYFLKEYKDKVKELTDKILEWQKNTDDNVCIKGIL